jgi:uncharacterized glyoxalase superfamily protein PhnB
LNLDASVSLSFNGDCKAAFNLYERLPGAKPAFVITCLSADDETEAERLFAALTDGGAVQMALQPTFFATRYGEVVDRFGIPWEIRCRKSHGDASG